MSRQACTARTHSTWDEGAVPANGEAVMSVALTRGGRTVAPLSDAFVTSVKLGEIVLYAHGRIECNDVYGRKH